MSTLSKEAEDQVIASIKQAVEMTNDGKQPTEALAAVAKTAQWGPDMVRFAAYAFNTGKQAAQREAATTTSEKFAEFPLADPEEIIRQLWPKDVKTAVERDLSEGVSAEYSKPPVWPARKAAQAKQASWSTPLVKQAAATEAAPEPLQRLFARREQLKKAADNARQAAATAYDRMLSSMSGLSGYFRKFAMDRLPFGAVEFATTTYFGDAGQQLMDWVYAKNQLTEDRAVGVKWASVPPMDTTQEPWATIKACCDRGRDVCEKRAAHEQAVEAFDQYTQSIGPRLIPAEPVQQSDSIIPVVQTPTYSAEKVASFFGESGLKTEISPTVPAAEEPWSLLSKQGTFLQSAAGAATGVKFKDVMERAMGAVEDGDEPSVNPMLAKLNDPQHDSQLRAVKTQALLADLMSSDDVIGSHDPNRVLQTYNEIAQMAPRSSSQPLVLRTLLRKHLQGNTEPFEVGQIAELEKRVMDLDRPERIMGNAGNSLIR